MEWCLDTGEKLPLRIRGEIRIIRDRLKSQIMILLVQSATYSVLCYIPFLLRFNMKQTRRVVLCRLRESGLTDVLQEGNI